jgi:hypothetical protein
MIFPTSISQVAGITDVHYHTGPSISFSCQERFGELKSLSSFEIIVLLPNKFAKYRRKWRLARIRNKWLICFW